MDEPKNIAVIVNQRYEAAKAARREIDKDIKLNIAFYEGRQWVTYDPYSSRVVDWYPPRGKPRPVTNLIMPVVRIEYAKISRNIPTFKVVANVPTQENIQKAKLAYTFLNYKWQVDDYEHEFNSALLMALLGGTGFIKVYYDPTAGATYKGQPIGDIVLDYCSPLEMFIDPLARSLKEASWVIHARVRSVEYVEKKYGIKVPGESLESNAILGSVGRFNIAKADSAPMGVTLVKEYWERPNEANPDGKYVVIAGGKVLYESDNPYKDVCPIPFTSMVHIPVPSRLWGESVVTQLRQINVVYNKIMSDIMENTTKLSNPPLVVPFGALKKEPEMSPGEIIYYNPLTAGKIDQLPIEPYPTQVLNTLLRLQQERDDISGINDVSRGAVPRGVRSGQALSYLLEQDTTRLSVTARHYEQMIEDTLQMVLDLAKEFYDVPRLIAFSADGSQDAILFKSSDIPDNVGVYVTAGSTLPRSETQAAEYYLSLWDRGIIQDPRLVTRITQYGSDEEITQELELDTGQALRENKKMQDGKQVPVEDYQNHFVHITEHNKFRKTEEYDKLSDDIKNIFAQHVEQHKQFMQQLQQQAQAAQQSQQHTGGGNPHGSTEAKQAGQTKQTSQPTE
jgi:hypothetical protein